MHGFPFFLKIRPILRTFRRKFFASALFAQVDWLEVGDGCVERIEPKMNGRAFQYSQTWILYVSC